MRAGEGGERCPSASRARAEEECVISAGTGDPSGSVGRVIGTRLGMKDVDVSSARPSD